MAQDFSNQPITLYDSNGNELAVQNGAAIPAGTSGILFMAADATGNAQQIRVKGANSPPAANDPSLVAVLSPNQPLLPVTTAPATATPGLAAGYLTTTVIANVALRATAYTEQTANFTGSVVSSSANDAAAGIGARTITIYYVDATGATAGTETVALNGTTAVNLAVTTKCFIEKIVVNTVGTNLVNAGTLTLFTGAGGTGTNVGSIAIGDNRTFWAHHYVVTGKTCSVTDMTGFNNSAANQSVFEIVAIAIPTANQPNLQLSDWITGNLTNQALRLYGSPLKVAGPARLTLMVAPSAAATIKSYGSFEYYDM